MQNRGFTLVEMVMVIVLTGIIASITAVFIVEPMRAYADQSRRAALVDQAEIALRRMGREIRAAVPNSVRVQGGGLTLQMYNAVSGARYRASAPPNDDDAILHFDRDDGSFDLLGGGFPGISEAGGLNSTAHFLVIYNLGTPGSDLYEGDAVATPVITPGGAQISVTGNRVGISPPFRFGWESPQQRVFLSDGDVVYTCNPVAGTLTRDGVIVTGDVSGCSFTYTPGTATRSALASMQLSLARDGESISLLRQVHVENLP